MTDEELIARLRDAPADGLGTENLCLEAADRIEALSISNATLAAQIEADATLTDQQFRSACLSYRHDFGMLDHDAQHAVIFDAREWWRAFRREIRNQPHDRTALDRHDAKTREKALREAYEVVYKWWFGDGNALPQELILALIEKPNAG